MPFSTPFRPIRHDPNDVLMHCPPPFYRFRDSDPDELLVERTHAGDANYFHELQRRFQADIDSVVLDNDFEHDEWDRINRD